MEIVIAGAGLSGLSAALELKKKFKKEKDIQLTLIDRHEYHLFWPELFEAAAADEELVSLENLKCSLTLPLPKMLSEKGIKFVRGEITRVDQKNWQVILPGRKIDFDYLILALGQENDLTTVAGVKQFALPFNTLEDAFRLKNRVAFAFEERRLNCSREPLRLIVLGGGKSGCALAAEMKGLVNFLAWKNDYPPEKSEITVLELQERLVPALPEKISRAAADRLHDLGIHVRTSARAAAITGSQVILVSGERLSYDVLVWNAGRRGRKIDFDIPSAINNKGQLAVNEFLQLLQDQRIFILGSLADSSKMDADPVLNAFHQAKYICKTLASLNKNRRPRAYRPVAEVPFLPLGAKWGIFVSKGFCWQGRIAYVLGRFRQLKFYAEFVGWSRAINFFRIQRKIFRRND